MRSTVSGRTLAGTGTSQCTPSRWTRVVNTRNYREGSRRGGGSRAHFPLAAQPLLLDAWALHQHSRTTAESQKSSVSRPPSGVLVIKNLVTQLSLSASSWELMTLWFVLDVPNYTFRIRQRAFYKRDINCNIILSRK